MSDTNDVRVNIPQSEWAIFYGPLANLIGTWKGNDGVNVIAVPNQKGDFTLLVESYYEVLEVTALSATTPNRGLKKIENIPTLMYSLKIHKTSDDSLMHAENGFWELLEADINAGFNITRLASVPHGDTLTLMGNSSDSTEPTINATLSSAPSGDLPAIFGYTDVYDPEVVPGFKTLSPNQWLIDHLATQASEGTVPTSTTTLTVSSEHGGISNIPSINSNTPATKMNATFWIETMKKKDGSTFQQLQYSQDITIDFPIKSNTEGQTIHWPHINVNTLIKQ